MIHFGFIVERFKGRAIKDKRKVQKEREIISNSNILALIFWLYSAAALILCLGLNQKTLLIFSPDKLLCSEVIFRIHRAQIIFFFFSFLLFVAGWIFKRGSIAERFSEKQIDLWVSISLFIFLIFCIESILCIKYSANYIPSLRKNLIVLPDKYLGHVLNPNVERTYKINSLGFRGEDFNVKKDVNEVRIFAVGDSITFGWGATEEKFTYPYKLQLLFNGIRDGKEYKVINAGVPRYTSLQALRFIKERILPLKPDLIILSIGWNDLEFSFWDNWYPEMEIEQDLYGKVETSFNPAILRAAKDLKFHLARIIVGTHNNKGKQGFPNELAIQYLRSNLCEIAKILRKYNVKIVITNLPSILSRRHMAAREMSKTNGFSHSKESLAIFEAVIDDVCNVMGVPCVRIFDLDTVGKGPYFYDHCHFSDQGSTVFSRRIFDFITTDSRFDELFN